MPYGSGTRFRLDVEATDQSINLSNQLRLFCAELVYIDDAIDTGRGDIRATRIERKVFCRLGQMAKMEDLEGIGDVDDLYSELAAGDQYLSASRVQMAYLLASYSRPLPVG